MKILILMILGVLPLNLQNEEIVIATIKIIAVSPEDVKMRTEYNNKIYSDPCEVVSHMRHIASDYCIELDTKNPIKKL